jgi:hypothetical protein
MFPPTSVQPPAGRLIFSIVSRVDNPFAFRNARASAMMKTLSILLGNSLVVGGLVFGGLIFGGGASPVSAVEMFTNFNNGMELGFRPYGIPEFPPVRYHSWQPQSWYTRHGMVRPCGNGQVEDYEGGPFGRPNTAVPAPPIPGNQSQNDPVELQAEPVADVSVAPSNRNAAAGWVRGQSFLPSN